MNHETRMPEKKICEVGNHQFELASEDIAAYQKFGFEPLPICFPHQHQWRLVFRNDRFLHHRKCDLTGAEIISIYPPDAPFKVYEREAWFSDRYSPLDYGRPFDFNKTFFEQFAELKQTVPHMALINVGSVNSDYCNMCVFNKNCYLIFGGDRNEDCLFGALPMYCKNCVDCDWTTRCELCYFCAYSETCYNCRFVFNSKNCTDCAFLEDCIGCSDCVLSFNLRSKSYYIENKPYTKEEYLVKKMEFFTGSYQKQEALWKRFLELRGERIAKYANILNCENVSGDIIFNSKNCQHCFECIGSEDCRECYTIFKSKDCFNSDYVGHSSQLTYNSISCDTAYRFWHSFWGIECSDVDYSMAVNFSKNIFGCFGMKHNEYGIFNKQYSKEDFLALKEKIIEHMKRTGEWGRFFPKSLGFPYNESTASYFLPRTKEEAIREGFAWRNETVQSKPQTYKIPGNIRDVPDTILNETLSCETTGKNFRIIPQELEFYRKQSLPIPRQHPDTRYADRLALRNPFKLFARECAKCGTIVQTTYAPERTEKVYCEKCYLKAVY